MMATTPHFGFVPIYVNIGCVAHQPTSEQFPFKIWLNIERGYRHLIASSGSGHR